MKKTKKLIAICFTFGLLISTGTNVYASSQSVDLSSNQTSNNSNTLNATSVIPIGTNVYASSGENYIVPVTERQVDIGGPSGPSVTVDIGSSHTSRNSSNLSARRTHLFATNSSASSGSLAARAQYRTGSVIFSWHNDVTRTIPRGNAATGNSHLFNNTQTWRLQLGRVNSNQPVTGSGRLTSI